MTTAPKLKKKTDETPKAEVNEMNTPTTFSMNDNEVFNLLAGYVDDEGTLHNTFTLREMTGRDEEAISKSDVRQNPAKAISLLLTRCVTSLGTLTRKEVGPEKWKDIIESLLVGDQDYMFLKLREISIGKEFEVRHKCPKCKAELVTYVDIDELDIVPFKGERVVSFELPKGYKNKQGKMYRLGKIRLPNGKDREIITPIARKNLAMANTLMLTRLCQFDEDGIYVTEDVMRDLLVRDREYLLNLMQDNVFGVDLSTDVTCTSCGTEFRGNFDAVNFM